MKQDHRDALLFALDKDIADPGDKGSWRFYNASPIPGLSDKWKSALVCEQGFRPEYLKLESQGYIFIDSVHQGKSGAIFLLGRNRLWNQFKIARAWNELETGNRLIVAGNKTDGVGSIRKWFSSHAGIADSKSKHHAVVFWADKPKASHIPPGEISQQIDGYLTAEGMFSSDGPDKGSKLLVEYFNDRIRGKVADLGAGWGYLSGELFKRSERVEELNLFEADYASLEAARKNLEGVACKTGFQWCDVTTEFPKKPYDWVIMNPPFHSGRAAEPELGKRFIEVAASTLPRGGRLLMVANRNLPYEKVLEKEFRKFEKLTEREGFKVIEATR